MSEFPTPERPNEQDGNPAETPAIPDVPDLAEPQAFTAPPGAVPPAYPAYQQPPEGYQQPPAPDQSGYPAYQQSPEGYQQPQPYAPPGYPQQQGYGQPGYVQPGYPQQPYPVYQPGIEQKSKLAAGLLGILLGGFGIHNFYLGFTSKALVQLLVSVLSLGFLYVFMAIWGLIEGILILTGSENFRNDSRGIPLKE